MTPRRARKQGGYGLLFVFALAAAIAFKLYLEMPRVAFEAQRNKEEMLVERGEQYIRGIQLFVRKMNRYPQNVDELEKTNNIRFLRRRYKDPMTGKDEWRLIHVDAAGMLTDSLVHKPNQQGDEKKNPSVLANTIQGIGASAEVITPGGGAQPAAALQRRASDRIVPGGLPGGPAGGSDESANPPPDGADPEGSSRSGPANPDDGPPPPSMNSPFQPVPSSGMPPGGQQIYQPGTMPPGFNPNMPGATPFQQPGMGGYPGAAPFPQSGMGGSYPGAAPFPQSGMGGSYPGAPPFSQSGMRGSYPGAPVNSQTGGMTGIPIGGVAPPQNPGQGRSGSAFGGGSFGGGTFGGGGFAGGQASGGGLGRMTGGMAGGAMGGMAAGQPGMMRPGQGMGPPGMPGMPGMPGAQQNPALQMINQILTGQRQNPAMRGGGAGGQNLGGGVAGVASKKDAEGIKIYKERTNYKEWEFIYDPKEEAATQMAKQGMPGATGNQQTPNIPGVPTLNQGPQPGPQPGAQPIAPKPGPAFGFGRQ